MEAIKKTNHSKNSIKGLNKACYTICSNPIIALHVDYSSMPNSFDQLHFTNHFAKLGSAFSQKVMPEPIEQAQIVSLNPQAGLLIDLDLEQTQIQAELLSILALEQLPNDSEAVASVYSGHQFGQYNPQLGDGRALLIGQVENSHQQLWELQLKGSGRTPYSRQGDGRAVLRSSIREYLCSEAMHGLGIATTRALALATSKTPVYRETIEPAATIIRMAPSHIRFGHFEYFHHQGQTDKVKQLADFVIKHHHPDLLGQEKPYDKWLETIVISTAKLIAQWQAAGFCHGVMNTDNMSILGLTIDYGPFGFIDGFDPGHICNHSDHTGRYAYFQQINIGLWNLNALAHALSSLISTEAIKAALSLYEGVFIQEYEALMLKKLGLTQSNSQQKDKDSHLIQQLLKMLSQAKTDYHWFFLKLSEAGTQACALDALRNELLNPSDFDAWLALYQQRLQDENNAIAGIEHQRQALMLANNPRFVLRNYLAQEAIEKAEQGDFSMVNDLLDLLQNPFSPKPEFDSWAERPPASSKNIVLSCSS